MMRGTACALSLSRDRQPPSKTGGVPPELRLHEGGDEIIAVIVTFVQAQCQPDPRRVAGVAQPVRLKLSVEELVGRALIHQKLRHPRPVLDQRDGIVPAPRGLVLTEIARQRLLPPRSEEHTSELQSLMRISYAVFCLKKKH